jgi:putative flippase GtrA
MVFAAVCTVINLGSQILVEWTLSPLETFQQVVTINLLIKTFSLQLYFLLKLAVGTILGFLAKFLLDKFVVFQEKHAGAGATLQQIFIYGLFAVVTTLIFWGFQISFELIFPAPYMDLIGGLLGLVIGYTLKYFLDKRFVFRSGV